MWVRKEGVPLEPVIRELLERTGAELSAGACEITLKYRRDFGEWIVFFHGADDAELDFHRLKDKDVHVHLEDGWIINFGRGAMSAWICWDEERQK